MKISNRIETADNHFFKGVLTYQNLAVLPFLQIGFVNSYIQVNFTNYLC